MPMKGLSRLFVFYHKINPGYWTFKDTNLDLYKCLGQVPKLVKGVTRILERYFKHYKANDLFPPVLERKLVILSNLMIMYESASLIDPFAI